MNINLKEINRENWRDIVDLKVHDEQLNFVASNAFSLAQAKYETECMPLAIYLDDKPVGFIMYVKPCIDHDDYWIYRLMIDKQYQGKGYGKNALQQVINIVKEDINYNKLFLSFEPENHGAKAMYENMGFKPTGDIIYGELVYVLNY